jgi:hypothetical protein
MERIHDYLERIIPAGNKCGGCRFDKGNFCDLSEEKTKNGRKICNFNEQK